MNTLWMTQIKDKHFAFLKEKLSSDNRIIGNVKNEAISLCRGKYVIEMDHDDAYNIFQTRRPNWFYIWC